MACGCQWWGPQDCGLALTGHPLWPGDPLAPPTGPSLPSFSCLLLDPHSQEGTPPCSTLRLWLDSGCLIPATASRDLGLSDGHGAGCASGTYGEPQLAPPAQWWVPGLCGSSLPPP